MRGRPTWGSAPTVPPTIPRDGSRFFGEKEGSAGAVGSGRVGVGGLGKSRFRERGIPPMLLLNVWK